MSNSHGILFFTYEKGKGMLTLRFYTMHNVKLLYYEKL